MVQATEPVRTSTRDLATAAAGSPAAAALVGSLVDLMLTVKRLPQASGGAWPLLLSLAVRGPLRASDLACSLHLDQSTVSRHVAALEAEGLVRREQHKQDRRAQQVELTGAGDEVVMAGIGTRVQQFEAAVDGWPPGDVETLARLIDRFVAGLMAQEGTTPA